MIDKKPIQFDFNDREEVNHRFQGNVIGYVKDDEVLPFRMMHASRNAFEGELYNPKTGDYDMKVLEAPHDAFAWAFPELGYVNVDNLSVYLMRQPGRYYTRGFNARHVSSLNAFQPELRELNVTKRYDRSANGKVLYSLMNREYDDFHTALNSIEDSSYLARAFSREWCIGIKLFSNKPVIYYKGNMVGFYSEGHAKLVPTSAFLKESLSAHTPVLIVEDFKEMYG